MDPLTEAPAFLAIWGTGAAIFVLLLLSALFSGSETALTTASRGKLHGMAERGEAAAARALKLTDDKERLIGALLLGNNLANILGTSLATWLFTRLLGDGAVAIATVVMTVLVLVFAEVLPKTYAITNAEIWSVWASRFIQILVMVLSPLVNAVRAFVRLILRVFGVRTDPGKTCSPPSRRSPAPSRCITRKAPWRRPTATGSSARSTSASARSRR